MAARSPDSAALDLPGDARQVELADRIARFTRVDGQHETPCPALHLIRMSSPSQALPSVYEPSLCLVVQGAKRALLGAEVYHYDELNYLVVSVTLPMIGQVLDASPEKPYLCLRIALDPAEIARLMVDMGPRAPREPREARGLYCARVGSELLDAVVRLMRLLDEPRDLPVLAPLALREIHYRLLLGDLGERLRDLVDAGGVTQRVAPAIAMIKARFAEPLSIEELAARVHMSVSSLHHRFKAVTAMSPLQFQKHLRLHEARRLMLRDDLDAAAAAHRVGYESASQFSREYRRLFGAPPRREISRLRDTAVGG